MQKPATPPDWREVLHKILGGEADFTQLVAAVPGPTYRGRYLHWDKLRRLALPPDVPSHDAWWGGLKFRRSSMLKPVPLKDVSGRPFVYAVPDEAMELLHTLDRDAAGQIQVGEQVVNRDTRDRYVVRSLMEEAITSSQLEGAATTRKVAKEMLRTGRRPRDRGERMIVNNYAAMQHIVRVKDQSLSPDMVTDLQRILTQDAVDESDWVGRLRRAGEPVVVEDNFGAVLHTPPDAAELPERMKAMCAFANGREPTGFIHPVIRAIVLHFWLAYDHPFCDGNGRSARALFYWSMLRSQYWLAEFLSISPFLRRAPARYGRAFLYSETDGNDLTYFILFHLELVRRAINEIQQYVNAKVAEVRDAERLLRNADGLNHRQVALLTHALRHPDASYTLEGHRASHQVVYETARQDVYGLVERGLLESQRRGRALHFFPVRDFESRLRRLR